ncbi:hypothetical protein [Micromonospora noduli]|uniref:Uncharacterized protein n=1 Tax=Micromonospora noduli TaxID=709876 RepID=A0A328NBS2_9ACTN|nr:hypothetical protein [Micromonospora noduli]RAO04188.1 hypothetical protein LAH08_01536 [Micromonospora noduli]
MGWRVHFTRRRLLTPKAPRPLLLALPLGQIKSWLDEEDIPERLPCLIALDGTYDLELNRYFLQDHLMAASENTQAAVAYDLANF